jgi:hypothetical protein
MALSIDKQIRIDVSQYNALLRFYGSSRNRLKLPPALSLADPFTGLMNLLRTTTAVTYAKPGYTLRSEVEWNPISQRVVLDALTDGSSAIDASFEMAYAVVRAFINMAHETMHVVLWEPFFTGELPVRNQKQFLEYSLLFEAFCFWYADIIVTPLLRRRFPDAELVFARSAVSEPHFSPYRAFQKMGNTDKLDVLSLYLNAFSGYRTSLLDAKGIFPESLSRRFYKFYLGAKTPSYRHFRLMKEAGIFDEFFRRFCRIPNLPSIVSADEARLFDSGDPKRYFVEMLREVLPRMERERPASITSLRLRRAFQTRAYFCYILAQNLRSGRFVARRPLPAAKVLKDISAYLDLLEQGLGNLAAGSSPHAVNEHLSRADRFFDGKVCSRLGNADAWVSRIDVVLPYSRYQAGQITPDTALSSKSINHYLQKVGKFVSVIEKRRGILPREILTDSHKLFYLASKCGQSGNAAKRLQVDFVKVHNRLVSHPLMRGSWSRPLGAIDPLNNSFSELLFIYD